MPRRSRVRGSMEVVIYDVILVILIGLVVLFFIFKKNEYATTSAIMVLIVAVLKPFILKILRAFRE